MPSQTLSSDGVASRTNRSRLWMLMDYANSESKVRLRRFQNDQPCSQEGNPVLLRWKPRGGWDQYQSSFQAVSSLQIKMEQCMHNVEMAPERTP